MLEIVFSYVSFEINLSAMQLTVLEIQKPAQSSVCPQIRQLVSHHCASPHMPYIGAVGYTKQCQTDHGQFLSL